MHDGTGSFVASLNLTLEIRWAQPEINLGEVLIQITMLRLLSLRLLLSWKNIHGIMQQANVWFELG